MPDESVASIIASQADGILISSPMYVSWERFWLSYLLEAPKGHSRVSADSTPG